MFSLLAFSALFTMILISAVSGYLHFLAFKIVTGMIPLALFAFTAYLHSKAMTTPESKISHFLNPSIIVGDFICLIRIICSIF